MFLAPLFYAAAPVSLKQVRLVLTETCGLTVVPLRLERTHRAVCVAPLSVRQYHLPQLSLP